MTTHPSPPDNAELIAREPFYKTLELPCEFHNGSAFVRLGIAERALDEAANKIAELEAQVEALSQPRPDGATGGTNVCDSRQEDVGGRRLQGDSCGSGSGPVGRGGSRKGRDNQSALPISGSPRSATPISPEIHKPDDQLAPATTDVVERVARATDEGRVLPEAPHWNGVGKYGSAICLDECTLHIMSRGFGTKDGDGYFAFDPNKFDWDRDEEGNDFIVVPLHNSDLLFVRDQLNKLFPATAAVDASAIGRGELEQLRAFKARVMAAVQFEVPEPTDDAAIYADIAAGLSLRKTAAKHGLSVGQVRGAGKRETLRRAALKTGRSEP